MAQGKCSKCLIVLTEENAPPSVFKVGSGWCRACKAIGDAERQTDPVRRADKARKRREAWKNMPLEEKEARLEKARVIDNARYRKLTPEKKAKRIVSARISRRRIATGVGKEDFEKMLIEQCGLCAICNKEMKRPCQDHNHFTNTPREILCHNCNVMLGHSFENKDILTSAI